jgi:putative transcription factor
MFPSEKKETYLKRVSEGKHMHCELCGKDTELFTAMVEGAQMKVCANCGKFGKVLRREIAPARAKQAPALREPEIIERLVSDYGQRIRAAREKQGLTQEEFARKIMQKESLLHKMETGTFEPQIELARKLERVLGITLVEVRQDMPIAVAKTGHAEGMTIGDILKAKLKG